MKLLDLAKKIGHASTCDIIIRQGGKKIKTPQRPCELERKINDEIIENFTVSYFSIIDDTLIIQVK